MSIAFRGLGDNEFICILIHTLIKYGFFESNPGTLLSLCILPGNLEKKKISSLRILSSHTRLCTPRPPRHHAAQLPPVGRGVHAVQGAARVALKNISHAYFSFLLHVFHLTRVPVGLPGAHHGVQHVAVQGLVVGHALLLLPHPHIHLLQGGACGPTEVYCAPT